MSGSGQSGTGGTGSAVAGPIQPSNNILNPFTPQQLQTNNTGSQLLRGAASQAGVRSGTRFEQLAQSVSFVPVYGQASVVNLTPVPVGLITKYLIEVICTVTNPDAGTSMSRTGFGAWNMLSNITYTDPSQNQRVNTYGFHLACVAAMRRRRVPGSAITTDSPSGFGSVVQPITAPSTIANNNTPVVVRAIFELPLSTGRNSTKGAVVGGTVFSNQQLQITFNPNFCQNSTDGMLAGYTGASNANPPTFSVTVNLWQHYWDQYSQGLLNLIAPDLSYIYELKSTLFTPLVANVNNFFRYQPLREYWSTILSFDNGGVENAGTDINNFMLQAANQTTFWTRTPSIQAFVQRNAFGDDPPAGTYFFDTHDTPIITAAEGNTLLMMNPSSLGAGPPTPYVIVSWEDIGIASVLAAAPSLAGTGGS